MSSTHTRISVSSYTNGRVYSWRSGGCFEDQVSEIAAEHVHAGPIKDTSARSCFLRSQQRVGVVHGRYESGTPLEIDEAA